MAKKKKIPVGGSKPSSKCGITPPTSGDNDSNVDDDPIIDCPVINTDPDIKEIVIDEPTILNLSCPTPNITCPEGVSPELFNEIMRPITRKLCNLEKLAQAQLCVFSKFVKNSDKKIVEKKVCLEDGTEGCQYLEHDPEAQTLTPIGLVDSNGEPTELAKVDCPDILIEFIKTCQMSAQICRKKTEVDGAITIEYILVGTATLEDGTALEDGAVLTPEQYAELTTCPVTEIVTKEIPLCYEDSASTEDPKPHLSGTTCVTVSVIDGIPDYANQIVVHFDTDLTDITASIDDGTFVKVECAKEQPPQIQVCEQCINMAAEGEPAVWEKRKLHTVYVQLDDGSFDTSTSFVTDLALVKTEETPADLQDCPKITYDTISTCSVVTDGEKRVGDQVKTASKRVKGKK